MTIRPNEQYNLAPAGSLPVRIAATARRKMFQVFLDESAITAGQQLLDVGVTSDRTYEASNYVEAWYPHSGDVTAVGLDDAGFLPRLYPGMSFVRADGLRLPFRDGSFDVVHSSAVIEHVGGADRQSRLIAELCRVARRLVCITTPNRRYPIEFHTLLPLIHWLPKPLHRRLLHSVGYGFFAQEDNLNLLTKSDLISICRRLCIASYRVRSISTFGLPSNLILIIHKKADDDAPA